MGLRNTSLCDGWLRCRKTRRDEREVSSLARWWHEMGANAIIAMRYDATDLMGGVTEVIAYGGGYRHAPTRTRRIRTFGPDSGRIRALGTKGFDREEWT